MEHLHRFEEELDTRRSHVYLTRGLAYGVLVSRLDLLVQVWDEGRREGVGEVGGGEEAKDPLPRLRRHGGHRARGNTLAEELVVQLREGRGCCYVLKHPFISIKRGALPSPGSCYHWDNPISGNSKKAQHSHLLVKAESTGGLGLYVRWAIQAL